MLKVHDVVMSKLREAMAGAIKARGFVNQRHDSTHGFSSSNPPLNLNTQASVPRGGRNQDDSLIQ